jgi:ATP-binding cassette subfamily A (ABC1) protein 3
MVKENCLIFALGRKLINFKIMSIEADVLCDKIAIMNHGELKCFGSPKFLKANFGQGYRIGIIKGDSFNTIVFTNIIELFDFDFIVETDVASEMSLILPNVSTYNLIELLRAIEENKSFIGISSFSISSTTIEEVFFK